VEKGSLGIYENVGPIPGRTTTLDSPLRIGAILFASVAQPLTQQHKVGLGIDLSRVAVKAADEEIRAKRQSIKNEVRRLYFGIVQAESGQKNLQATIDFLKELDREVGQKTAQQVALRFDSLDIKAKLAQAEYELLKLDDPVQTQKEQLNRLLGRDVRTSFDVDPLSAVAFELAPLQQAYTEALESRPEIRIAKLQLQRAELDRRMKNAERIPDVSLALTALKTVNFSNALPSNLSGVGIQANWDVFDWGRKQKQVEQKRDTERQALLELKDVEALVMVDVGHQYRRAIEARKEMEVARMLQTSGAELLRVTRNRYMQREAMLSDVLKVQSGLAEADYRFTQALVNAATAQADLEKAMGRD
jgi:outer membrane protein TolC